MAVRVEKDHRMDVDNTSHQVKMEVLLLHTIMYYQPIISVFPLVHRGNMSLLPVASCCLAA